MRNTIHRELRDAYKTYNEKAFLIGFYVWSEMLFLLNYLKYLLINKILDFLFTKRLSCGIIQDGVICAEFLPKGRSLLI